MQECYINSLYKNIGDELKLGTLISSEVIQSLWSGYGEIVRLVFKNKSVIVKHIKLPKKAEHPKGWNSSFSHKRKLYSYEVEVNWYEKFSNTVDNNCLTPQCLKTFHTQDESLIVMEDLSSLGFNTIVKNANRNHLKASIFWLANFHAKHLNTKSDLIWKVGTYWHLDTRPDELKTLEDKELKKYAKQIDDELKNCKYQTIVHGDAKLANFCFNEYGTSCAAVDFQYVGHGCGMKDLILFMSSAVEPKDCAKMEKWITDTYFEIFNKSVKYYHPKINSKEIEFEWRPLFYVAWADFQRFIKAWSPNHHKINSYTEELTLKALLYLKSKNK